MQVNLNQNPIKYSQNSNRKNTQSNPSFKAGVSLEFLKAAKKLEVDHPKLYKRFLNKVHEILPFGNPTTFYHLKVKYQNMLEVVDCKKVNDKIVPENADFIYKNDNFIKVIKNFLSKTEHDVLIDESKVASFNRTNPYRLQPPNKNEIVTFEKLAEISPKLET